MNDLHLGFKAEAVEDFFKQQSQLAKIFFGFDAVLETVLAGSYPTYNVLSVSDRCSEQALAALARSDIYPAINIFLLAMLAAGPVVFIDLTRSLFGLNHKFKHENFVRFERGRLLIFLVFFLLILSIVLTVWGASYAGHFLKVTSREQILAYAHCNA